MPSIFESQTPRALTIPKITDRKGLQEFNLARERIVDSISAKSYLDSAETGRLGDAVAQHTSAYIYLALAFRLTTDPELLPHFRSGTLFHFAGAGFRGLGQLNRAGDAYWRAGILSVENGIPSEFGIRSLARAKCCFSEIGESELSDEMHVLEWEARRLRAKKYKRLLYIWKVTSCYGTNANRWFVSFLTFILFFWLSYEGLHVCGFLHSARAWTYGVTGAYFTIVTSATVGFGDIVPTNWFAQVVVATNILLAYVLLGAGASILGRKVIGR